MPTTTESPTSSTSFQNGRNEQSINRHNHYQRATTADTTAEMAKANDEENFLNKKRKLLKKPLKLRRQRLQHDEIEDSNSMSATTSGTINDNNNNNSHHQRHHQLQSQTPPPRLTEQILTREYCLKQYHW